MLLPHAAQLRFDFPDIPPDAKHRNNDECSDKHPEQRCRKGQDLWEADSHNAPEYTLGAGNLGDRREASAGRGDELGERPLGRRGVE